MFYKLDFFAEPMHYNYEGKDRFGSIQGVFISLLYYTAMIAYCGKVLNRYVNKYNPDIAISTLKNESSPDQVLNVNDEGFKLAFSVIDYIDTSVLNDPNHVTWDVYLEERKNLELVNKIPLRTHVCNEEDYAKFYPIDSA